MSSKVELNVSDIVPDFLKMLEKTGSAKAFPNTLGALNAVGDLLVITWRSFASGTPIPGVPRVIKSRGDYSRSIGADLSKPTEKVIYTTSPHHKHIEEGHGQIDLKPGLLSGPKARSGANGMYNIVAFRHGTPGTGSENRPMPLNVYKFMQKVNQTRQDTSRVTANNKGAQPQRAYSWGGRHPQTSQGQRSHVKSLGAYTWKTGAYSGMVRMDTSTSKARHSGYITFRVVSTKSDPASWIVPPIEGIPIREKVLEFNKERIEMMIKAAMEADLV